MADPMPSTFSGRLSWPMPVRTRAVTGIVRSAPRHHHSWLEALGPIAGVVTALMQTHLERVRRADLTTVLTPREDQVVKLIAEGHPSKTIADLLTISLKTVEHHRANILQKLGMRDRNRVDPVRDSSGASLNPEVV